MNLKSLENWVVEKNLKSVPGVVDVNPFGGPTREYQVRLDPEKLVTYGLSLSQVEQQLRRITPMPAAASSSRGCSRSTFAKWAWFEIFKTSKTRSSQPRAEFRCA